MRCAKRTRNSPSCCSISQRSRVRRVWRYRRGMTSNDAPLMLSVSGLRGLVGKTITAEVAALYGAAFGSHLRSKKNRPRVVLARDSRPSGEAFLSAVAAGLASTGCDVIDLGIAMTPTAGVMVQHHKADGGMVCTASHNPIEWNGLKCLDGDGVAPPPDEAKEIVRRFQQRDLKLAGPTEFGHIRRDTSADATHVAKVLALVDIAAIRAANLLMNNDANGADWIKFSRVTDAVKEGATFAEASAAVAAAGGSGRGGREGRGPRRRG